MTQQNRVLEWLAQEVKASSLSQRQIAEGVGYSPSTINQVLNGNYEKPDAIIDRMVNFFRQRHQRADIIETRNYEECQNFFDTVIPKNALGMVVGNSGFGKTKICKHYAANHDNVAYVEIDRSMNVKEVLVALAEAMLINVAKGSLYDWKNTIKTALRKKPRHIIIDQADLLPMKAFDILRTIHDDGHCSMIFAGMPTVISAMTSNPRYGADMSYLYSRVRHLFNLTGPTVKDVLLFAEKFDLNVGNEMIKQLLTWISCRGEFRLLKSIFEDAKDFKQAGIMDTDEERVQAAYQNLLKRETAHDVAYA